MLGTENLMCVLVGALVGLLESVRKSFTVVLRSAVCWMGPVGKSWTIVLAGAEPP